MSNFGKDMKVTFCVSQEDYLLFDNVGDDIKFIDCSGEEQVKLFNGTLSELAELIRQHEELIRKVEL